MVVSSFVKHSPGFYRCAGCREGDSGPRHVYRRLLQDPGQPLYHCSNKSVKANLREIKKNNYFHIDTAKETGLLLLHTTGVGERKMNCTV